MRPPKYTSLPDYFWAKVEESPTGCWLWTGKKDYGYGRVGINGQLYRTHRASAVDAKGDIPKGMFVLHTCDVRACVNPEHLYYGSHSDNMNDMVNRGRAAVGERHNSSKLTNEDVLTIDRLAQSGQYTHSEIADMFDTSRANVSSIVSGKTWSSVTGKTKIPRVRKRKPTKSEQSLTEATEVIKQLVDGYDAGTLELDNEAVVTKARAFLDSLT